jgi:hypothetical protein
VTWRNGTNRQWVAHLAALRVTPAHDWRQHRVALEIWLLFERYLGATVRVKALSRRAASDRLAPIARAIGASSLGHQATVRRI